MRRLSGSTTLLAALGCVALLAPLLAGGRPLVSFTNEGLEAPAAASLLRLLPEGAPAGTEDRGASSTRQVIWSIQPPVEHDPLAIDLERRLLPPGTSNWMGTDELGRDVLARMIHGSRPSLLVAAIATIISLGLGIPIGAAAGYGGRRTDILLSRLIDAALAFPALVLLMLFAAISLNVVGAPDRGASYSLLVVGLAVGLARWGVIARYMRAEVRRLARSDLELAARATGASPMRVLAAHVVPSGMAPVLVSAAFGAGAAVVAEASLSFLGMGVQPPAPTWGQMIASAWQHGAGHWWLLLFPSAMVALTVGAFNRVGETLRRRAA